MATIPSREEWEARQAHLPDAAVATLAKDADRQRQMVAEYQKQREDAIRRRKAHRDQFEADLAAVLIELGAEWLALYRAQDHECECAKPFDLDTFTFIPKFDPRPIGLWPLYVEMRCCARAEDPSLTVWLPWGRAWTVAKPGDVRQFEDFTEALSYAATHTDTPF